MNISLPSMYTGKVHTMDLPVTEQQIEAWQRGARIQDVMPHLSPDQREFLITGITNEEWAALFGDDDV